MYELIPKITNNNKLTLELVKTDYICVKYNDSLDKFCISDVEDIDDNVEIKNFDIGLISDPNVIFRSGKVAIRRSIEVYTINGIDFILPKRFDSIFDLRYNIVKKYFNSEMIKLFEDMDIIEFSDSAFFVNVIKHYAKTTNSEIIIGNSDVETDIIRNMVLGNGKFISLADEKILNYNRKDIKPTFDEEAFNSIVNNPVFSSLDNNKKPIINILYNEYNVDSNNKYILKILFELSNRHVYTKNQVIDFLNSSRNYDIMKEYSNDLYHMYNGYHGDEDFISKYNLTDKEVYLMKRDIREHDIAYREFIGLKDRVSNILMNYKFQ